MPTGAPRFGRAKRPSPIATANGSPPPAADPGGGAKNVNRPRGERDPGAPSPAQEEIAQLAARDDERDGEATRENIQNSVGRTYSRPQSAPSTIIAFTSPAPSQRSTNGTNSTPSATPAPASA